MKIYKIINLINSKIYIGQTIRSLKERWKEHCKPSSECSAISNAIKKYGRDSFKIEELDTAETVEELNKLEEYHIEQLNSMRPVGYNISGGGLNKFHSKETKKKISNTKKKVYHPYRGKFGKDTPRFGKKCSKKQRLNMSLGHGAKPFCVFKIIEYKGSRFHNNYSIVKKEYIGIWTNQAECAEYLKISSKCISQNLCKKNKIAQGYVFKYVENIYG